MIVNLQIFLILVVIAHVCANAHTHYYYAYNMIYVNVFHRHLEESSIVVYRSAMQMTEFCVNDDKGGGNGSIRVIIVWSR